MSICTAGKKWDEQKSCYFSEKSSVENRCMHFVMEKFCDCHEAQKAEYSPVVSMEKPKMLRATFKKEIEHELNSRICPIDKESICAKEWCNQWNWCSTKNSVHYK
jgi:hypothetical protein